MYSNYLGIDISKLTFDVALLKANKLKHKKFNNNQKGFEALKAWLEKFAAQPVHACMEATGRYGEALATYLFDQGMRVSVVNPARIKGFAKSQLARNKTDKADANLIAQFCQALSPNDWKPTPKNRRILQELVNRLDSLTEMKQQEKNRLHEANDIVKPSIEKVILHLEKEIKVIKEKINDHIKNDPTFHKNGELLDSIKGLGEITIAKVLAFIDIDKFNHAKQVAAFIGMNPKHIQSGTSINQRSRISKTGSSQLRCAFYMPAMVAMRHNPAIKKFSLRLKERGKNGKVIICAIMRKLIHIIYGILKNQKPFNPELAVNFS